MDKASLEQHLAELNHGIDAPWQLRGQQLQKDFVFANFRQALAFMRAVGQYAEVLDHHPDWCNSYNKVEVSLSTHSAGRLTALDFKLAKLMEQEASILQQVEGRSM